MLSPLGGDNKASRFSGELLTAGFFMIDVSDLSFSYSGAEPWLFDQLSMSVPDGAYATLLGRNGAGKSTLIHLILGFLKAAAGTVRVGTDCVGYVPQAAAPVGRDFPMTGEELIMSFVRARRGGSVKAARFAARAALEAVGLADHGGKRIGMLSGGQRQRVMVARALALESPLIILDEPATGVDPDARRSLYELLARVNREEGVTILSVDHNIEAALSVSTMVLHLADGKVHPCSPEAYCNENLSAMQLPNITIKRALGRCACGCIPPAAKRGEAGRV